MAKILVVDDDVGVIVLLKTVLEKDGHCVITAANGVEALAVIPDDGVHLVVTDIIMPKLDGFELIPELLDRFPGQKIIAISGARQWDPRDALNAARDLGAVRCVEKPLDLNAFCGHVEDLLGEEEFARPA